MKYIIDLPDEFAEATKEYWDKTVGLQLEPYTEPSEAIKNEVWNFLAFLIDEMDLDEKYECFGMSSVYKVVSNMSYQEAKVKYEEWLKKKNEIRIGEEIVGIYSDGEKSPPLVVLRVEGDYYYGIYSKTGDFIQGGLNYEKTGRYFPEVAEFLEKMKE